MKQNDIQKFSAIIQSDFSEIIDDAIDLQKQAQVNGVDLTVREIFTLEGEGVIDFDNAKRKLPENKPLPLNENTFWQLKPGAYVIRYNEIVSVPMNAVGILQPRSTLLRMGGTIVGAWWDSGYSGRGQGLLMVNHPIKIYKNARIAQLVFLKAKNTTQGYQGKYQNEDK
jgi:dUTP pyrophosphatase